MRELLSSRTTPLFRNVFPTVWSVMFGLGSLAIWVLPLGGDNPPPLGVKVLFPVIWAFGSVLIFTLARRMRTVWLDGDTLVVRAGQEEWLIPLASVEEITERRHRNPRIQVSARGPTGELVKVRFIPARVFRLPFKPHPVAVRLREEVAAARAALPRAR